MVTVSLCLTDQPRGHPREEGVLRAGRRVHRAVMVAVMEAYGSLSLCVSLTSTVAIVLCWRPNGHCLSVSH